MNSKKNSSLRNYMRKYGSCKNNLNIWTSRVLYLCVDFWLLAYESRDLSQIESKVITVTSWLNWLFHLKWSGFQKFQLLTRVIFFSAWEVSCDYMSQLTKTITDVERLWCLKPFYVLVVWDDFFFNLFFYLSRLRGKPGKISSLHCGCCS